jgi:hypothetical protein
MVTRSKPLLISALAIPWLACVDTEPGERPFSIEVLTLTGVNSTTGAGEYALRPVDFPELISVSPLRDAQFRFIAEPSIDLDRINKVPEVDVAAALRQGATYTPRLRNLNGTLVPRDVTSLQIMSGYASLRAVSDALPDLTGHTIDDLFPSQGLQVWVKPTFTSGSLTQQFATNAFYLPYGDTFGFLDFRAIERLPLVYQARRHLRRHGDRRCLPGTVCAGARHRRHQ